MRSAVTAGVSAFVVVAAVMVAAGPASAKGPVAATVSGPGIDDPIDVLDTISADDTGVWHALSDFADPGVLTSAPGTDLGPRYTLVWEMMSGPEETTPILQHLYLDAEGGPVAHTETGQPVGDAVTSDRWYRMPNRVRDILAAEGVPVDGVKTVTPDAAAGSKNQPAAGAEVDDAASRRAADPDTAGDPRWPTATAAAGGAAALGAGVVVMARRRLASRQRRRVDVTRL
jgi:hypothetical protein